MRKGVKPIKIPAEIVLLAPEDSADDEDRDGRVSCNSEQSKHDRAVSSGRKPKPLDISHICW
jgi:hypothetical protein